MTGASELADAIIRLGGRPTPLTAGVGVISSVKATSDTTGSGTWVRVTGLLDVPIEVSSPSFSVEFQRDVGANGSGLVGKRVVVWFINQQPVIAFRLGDVSNAPT